MAGIVNLRMARKRRARAEREAQADRNRLEHGVPKALTEKAQAERRLAQQALDGHRRERPGGTEEK